MTRKPPKGKSLSEVNPELVKEWHPTANGNLTPKNVKILNSKGVWWICNKSHEWIATIKSRIDGSGCPLCTKDAEKILTHDDKTISRKTFSTSYTKKNLRKQSIFFESESIDPSLGRDFRKAKRFKINSLATVEIPSTGHWFYAEMKKKVISKA